jgi:hypothetical protein
VLTQGPPLSVLLLANAPAGQANTVIEHVDALRRLSRHDVRVFNPVLLKRSRMLDLDEFDVVVIHYSIHPIGDYYLAPALREAVRRFPGLKVQIRQDEYRSVDRVTESIGDLGIGVLFSLIPEREIDSVYPPGRLPGVERITTLAGWVPLGAERWPRPRLETRPFDVVYRGRQIPYWIGRLGQEKAWIGEEMLGRAAVHGLRVDIDCREEARIYGAAWNAFLRLGRATLGTESGASIIDFDGSLQERVKAYLAERPEASFEEVHRAILAPYEGNGMINVVSPRVFEAVANGTALVLFPGKYSGVVEPDRHYITLSKDFSNFDEVVERLRDLDGLRAMTERAHEEIVMSGRYSISRWVDQFDRAIDEHGRPRRSTPQFKPRHAAAQLERRVMLSIGLLDAALKAGLALTLAWRWPELRRLLRVYARSSALAGRPLSPPLHVLDDALKLAVLRQVSRGQLPRGGEPRVAVERRLTGGVLVFRTVVADKDAAPEVTVANTNGGVPSRLVWDHTAAGRAVRWPLPLGWSLRIAVGAEGVHEFRALADLSVHLPAEVRAVLRPESQQR